MIDRYLERYAAVRSFMEEAVEQVSRTGTSRPCSGAAGTSRTPLPQPQTRKAASAGNQHAHPGHRRGHHQIAMVHWTRRLAAGGFRGRGCSSRSTTSSCSRAPRRPRPPRRSSRARWSQAAELDPPLVVDVGVGPNWLAAK